MIRNHGPQTRGEVGEHNQDFTFAQTLDCEGNARSLCYLHDLGKENSVMLRLHTAGKTALVLATDIRKTCP